MCAASTQAAPVIVNHANVAAIDAVPDATLQALARERVFFAHASVGSNIVDGMRDLHAQNPARYPLVIAGAGDRPGATKNGTLYEIGRGNPGASAKISGFSQYVNNGWHSPAVNVVINKFCYIDPDASFTEYTSSMAAVERGNPGTTVVYFTIPLTTGRSSDNAKREAFNNKLREWAKANDKVLFDLADIEAWTTSGIQTAFSLSGQQVQGMAEEYSADGGHLNGAGRTRAAKGIYSLLALIASRR
jgi:hypothetical protein